MSEYNAADGAQEFGFPEMIAGRTLSVDAGTGTVTVEVWTGGVYVTDPDLVFTSDVVREITVSRSKLRITATGDAVFGFDGA